MHHICNPMDSRISISVSSNVQFPSFCYGKWLGLGFTENPLRQMRDRLSTLFQYIPLGTGSIRKIKGGNNIPAFLVIVWFEIDNYDPGLLEFRDGIFQRAGHRRVRMDEPAYLFSQFQSLYNESQERGRK